MKKICRNEASFSDVFHFAEENFQKSWNTCCDIFHNIEFFEYKKFDDFELSELEADRDEDSEYEDEFKDECTDARNIMIAYMKHHEVKRCRIYST